MSQRPASIDYDGALSRAYEPGRSIAPEAEQTWRRAVHPYITETTTVLDVGAGTGRFARLFADLAGRVIAIEPASGMRATARRVSRHRALHWLAGTAEHLPLADASTDVVWTAFTTHYFHLDAAGHELRRVLRGHGHLLVWHAFEDVRDDLEWYRWFPSAREVDEQRMPPFDQVAAAFATAGLELVERTTHQMLIAHDLHELADRLAHRAVSTLLLISDDEFEQGIRDLRTFADRGRSDAVYSPNALAVFRPRRA